MSVAQATSNRVKRMKKGTLFVRKAFAEVGSRAAVDDALFRLVQSGCPFVGCTGNESASSRLCCSLLRPVCAVYSTDFFVEFIQIIPRSAR